MKTISVLLFITIVISACSTPKPTKISFAGSMQPINVDHEIGNTYNFIIKSSQTQGGFRKRFVYSIDENQEYLPAFFYAIAHADKIIARIKPPFIDFVFKKTESNLKNYGVTAQIELAIANHNDQKSQVVLECLKYVLKK